MKATFRRHWKIAVGLAVLVAGLLFVVGSSRVVAYVGTGVEDTLGAGPGGLEDDGELALFDESVVHSIEMDFDQADFDAAISTYRETGEKEYFPADITIDGVTMENVGIRIKGNSTLRSALQNGADPDDIPYLVKLDKFVSGTSYQGFDELALRTEGPRGDELILEEMVTADVLELAGLPFPETTYTGLSINGGEETLRVVVELLDNGYVERLFDDDGVLYKAQSGNSFTYLGDDPTAYEDAFTQETSTKQPNLEPLIDFLEFVETSTDQEFEAQLEEWLDIESFTSYIVVNNLLASVDSMPGNGNNYYLWYDDEDDRFTVLAWDLNESFGGFWMGASVPSTELLPDWSNASGTEVGANAVAGQGPGGGGPPGGGPGGGVAAGGSNDVTFDFNNPLVDRFLATASFHDAYEERYAELFETLLSDGAVTDLINQYAEILVESNAGRQLVSDTELDSAVTAKLQWVLQRTSFLDSELGH